MPDSVTMANYNISFSGRVENPSDNTQTWIYRITKIGDLFPK